MTAFFAGSRCCPPAGPRGARALGLAAEAGRSRRKVADFVLWNVERPAELAYGIGSIPATRW